MFICMYEMFMEGGYYQIKDGRWEMGDDLDFDSISRAELS